MTWPRWLRRAVRNRHRHAIEQAARRWRGGRRDDSARTRRKILISTQVTATVVEVGWLMLEHVGRSAAVRRALETGVVLRVARAVHETQRERGLISTYVASDGRARALELGRQFLRTDAAMDLAVRVSVMNQRLAPSMRRRWLLDNNA